LLNKHPTLIFILSSIQRPYTALLIGLIGLWLSSGTMAPYAATHHTPRISEPCHYLLNLDQPHFEAPFRMLAGAPSKDWGWSVYLRRILYPLLAYLPTRIFGLLWGGFITNIIIYSTVFLIFGRFAEKRWGKKAMLTGLWLLATYPGMAYWAGLPYAHATIVPCTLLLFMILEHLNEADKMRLNLLALGLAAGVLFLAYDLLPFFGPAMALVLLRKRVWPIMPAVLLAAVLPSVVMGWILKQRGIDLYNGNTAAYWDIIASYWKGQDFLAWWNLIAAAPAIFWHNFLYSNFIFLPVLMLWAVPAGMVGVKQLPTRPEWALALSVLTVFLFNNLAPPYEGWQMRGVWIARIYQPIFVVYLSWMMRLSSLPEMKRFWRQSFHLLTIATVLANAHIISGPLLKLNLSDHIYYNFYQHSFPGALIKNMEAYGRRPLGLCAQVR